MSIFTITFKKGNSGSHVSQAGFTLIEIIVALALFAVVAVVAVGALVKIIGANKKAQSLSSAVNNVSFALESISRELRVGNAFHCESSTGSYGGDISAQACSLDSSATVLVFKSASTAIKTSDGVTKCNLLRAYRFVQEDSSFKLQKAEQSTCEESITESSFYDFLSPNVTLDKYGLSVSGDATSHQYYSAFIRLVGHAGLRDQDRTDFDVQTLISQRVPDLSQ